MIDDVMFAGLSAVGLLVCIAVILVLRNALDHRHAPLVDRLIHDLDDARRELRECRTHAASLAMLLTQERRDVENLRERLAATIADHTGKEE